MPDRPASCYRYFDTPAYTRRKYIRGVPGSKITKFDYGNPKGDFPVMVRLVPLEAGQIRHNALEAARVIVTKAMSVALGDTGYYLKVRTYPHQVLRENKMMAFAGADRLQDGMRRSSASRAAPPRGWFPSADHRPEGAGGQEEGGARRAEPRLRQDAHAMQGSRRRVSG
jgi:ribosomal protein L10e